MRVCVVHSSYEGTNSPFEKWDPMPDPGLYVDPSHHVFERRFVRKAHERDDIDMIVAERFDLYMNFMWGQLNDNVAGVEATRYLESKGVPLALSPSDFMAKTKRDFCNAAAAAQDPEFRVPGDTPGRFPKILKYADGMASLGMDGSSVCYNADAVATKKAQLEKAEPAREVVVQDFVRGAEVTAIVVEMGAKGDVVALPPVEWVFASSATCSDDGLGGDDAKWLMHASKFDGLGGGSISHRFVPAGPTRDAICDAAVAAFKALGVQGRGGWGRLDARVEEGTGLVWALEMNHMPALFYPPDCRISDDFIVAETFPGGHSAFVDVLIHTRLQQLASSSASTSSAKNAPPGPDDAPRDGSAPPQAAGHREGDMLKAEGATIEQVYDSCVDTYEAVAASTDMRAWQTDMVRRFDAAGVTLDLACGTGAIGRLTRTSRPEAVVHGVDASAGMLRAPWCVSSYATLQHGLIQDAVVDPDAPFRKAAAAAPSSSRVGHAMHRPVVDHVTCFGALHFLDAAAFAATLSRVFSLARRSVSFDIYDVSAEYVDQIVARYGEGLRNHNNVAAYRRFGTPPGGWSKVAEDEILIFNSPSAGIDVRGFMVRFERGGGEV